MNTTVDNYYAIFAKSNRNGLHDGQPAIYARLSPTSSALFEEATIFLRDRYVVRSPSRPAWRTNTYALTFWLNFLNRLGVNWREACQHHLVQMRDALSMASSPATGEAYSYSTIAIRMMTAIEFCKFAGSRGEYYGDIVEGDLDRKIGSKSPIDTDILAHTRTGESVLGAYKLLPKRKSNNEDMRPLTVAEFKALQSEAGSPAANPGLDTRPSRNRLLIDIACLVGLRLSELLSLKTVSFVSLDTSSNKAQLLYPISVKGKRGKTRQPHFPRDLVRDIQAYIHGERASALRAGRILRDTGKLFLSSLNSRKPGVPIKQRRVEAILSELSLKAGLVRYENDKQSGKTRTIPNVSPHDLRHTFAVMMYYAISETGGDPTLHIQQQLGHDYADTTKKQYLNNAIAWAMLHGRGYANLGRLLEELTTQNSRARR